MHTQDEQASISALREALHKADFSLAHMMEYIGSAATATPMEAQALCFHIKDLVYEAAEKGVEDLSYADLMCDAIVRCTVSEEHRHIYPIERQDMSREQAIDFIGSTASHMRMLADSPDLLALAVAPVHASH